MAHIKLTIFSETTKRTNEALLNKKINEKFINGKNYGFALTKSKKI